MIRSKDTDDQEIQPQMNEAGTEILFPSSDEGGSKDNQTPVCNENAAREEGGTGTDISIGEKELFTNEVDVPAEDPVDEKHPNDLTQTKQSSALSPGPKRACLAKSVLDLQEPPEQERSSEYKDPNLYDDCQEMWEFGTMMFFLSKMRNLARKNELFLNTEYDEIAAFKKANENNQDEEGRKRVFKSSATKPLCVLQDTVSLRDIVDTMRDCSSAIKEVEGKLPNGLERIDFHIEIMETMLARGGDNAYQLVKFDDIREGEEIVPAIIVDNYRRQVVVAFRGSQSTNDWIVNLTVGKKWVKNPVFNLKKDKDTMRKSLIGKSKVCEKMLKRQPRYISMANGWYNSIMHESSKLGIGSKYDFIMKKLLEILEEKKGYKVSVTGISLGGALAQVFALHIATETNALVQKPIKCFSIATPKVGAMRYRKAVQLLEEMNHLRMIRIMNHDDPLIAMPREPITLCCLSPISVLGLLCQQGLFYRKAGVELLLSDDGIKFTHAKVPKLMVGHSRFSAQLFGHDFRSHYKRQKKIWKCFYELGTLELKLSEYRDAHGYPKYFERLQYNSEKIKCFDLEKLYKLSLEGGTENGTIRSVYA